MKNILTASIKIIFIVTLFSGIFACTHDITQKDIIYSIPYINSGISGLNHFRLSDKKGLIPLYADQFYKIHDKSDLSAEFKTYWSPDGLLVYCLVKDDQFYSDSSNPSKSDALEIFLAPYKGSTDIIKLTILPNNSNNFNPAVIIKKDYRTTRLKREININVSAKSKRKGSLTYFKVLIPLNGLGITPAINSMIAMQLCVNDSDIKGEQLKNQIQWYPAGNSNFNSFAMFNLLFTKKGIRFPKEASNCYIKDNEIINIFIFSNTTSQKNILICNNNHSLVSAEKIISFPASFSIPIGKINPEKDTLRIFLNRKLISVYDMFNVPRVYEKLEAPGIFENEIRFFEAQDRVSPSPENAILFIGSSSIKGWYDIKDYFPESEIIHRGFGGSTAFDALHYINRIVLNYKPSKIVYYEGDNDLAKGYSNEKIITEIESFINIVHSNLPGTKIYIIPPKPSYARFHLWDKYVKLNSILKQIPKKYPYVIYIDIVTPMFDDNGILRRDIFVGDSLHLNEKGFQIWGETIRRVMGFK